MQVLSGGFYSVPFLLLKALVGILLYEGVDNRNKGDKENHTENTQQISADKHGNKRPQRRKSHRAAHNMRVNELGFDKLHRKVNHKAEQRLFGAVHKGKHNAQRTGDKGADIRDKRADCRNNAD